MHRCLLLLYVNVLLLPLRSLSCTVNQDDSYIINRMLERKLIEDCRAMYTLAGIFFENQEKPPNSVRVKYTFRIPYSESCSSTCSCWKTSCNINCDPGYCCFEREFIWGRLPMYVQDSIFRELTMCSLVVGGLKEKHMTVPFNLTEATESSTDDNMCSGFSFPCSWCSGKAILKSDIVGTEQVLDSALKIRSKESTLDRALLTLTAKLQGYAAKVEKLEWLVYSSDLAFGYSAPYDRAAVLTIRTIIFFTFYFFVHMIIFMLVYKYRYRIYNNTCDYINESSINQALFWSFVLTTLLAFLCIAVITFVAGGFCMTVFQLIMLSIAVGFGLPHCLVVCLRMKKKSRKFFKLSSETDSRKSLCFLLNYSFQLILFSYLYFLPHIALYWTINFFASFIARPFSYLLILVYFGVSNVFIWVANAIGFHILFPVTCRKRGCRREIFAVCLIVASNSMNIITWGFIETYFYDKRVQATSFMTLLPGMVFTLLGWYLSGDLVKLFDMLVVPFPKTSKQAEVELSTDDESELREFYKEESPRKRYNVTRLRRVVAVVQRPTSLLMWNDPNRSSYTEIEDNTD